MNSMVQHHSASLAFGFCVDARDRRFTLDAADASERHAGELWRPPFARGLLAAEPESRDV